MRYDHAIVAKRRPVLDGSAALVAAPSGVVWTTVYDVSATLNGTDDGDGNADLTLLNVLKSAGLTASAGKANARITVRFGSASNNNGVPSTFRFGQAAAAGDAYDFAGTPATVTFPVTVTPGANAEYTSDSFALPENWDATKNYVFAWFPGATASHSITSATLANTDGYFKAGGNDAATVNKTGYSPLATTGFFITKVEVSP
jgi:hypothetical protein